jgi:8-oxo-dGTP pyrophosphatase MutT (NUDIX family)
VRLALDEQLASDPAVSRQQQKAMCAAAGGNSTLGIPKSVGEEFCTKVSTDASSHAAGILFVAPDGDVLVLRRASTEQNYGGHWGLPGGKSNDGETPLQAAQREAREEMGDAIPNGPLKLLDARVTPAGVAFYTFAQGVGSKFVPKLNDEHSGYAWAPLGDLPEPLHPGVHSTMQDRFMSDKDALDMSPEDWIGLREGFAKWTREEQVEGEHAEDAEVSSADVAHAITVINSGHTNPADLNKAKLTLTRAVQQYKDVGKRPPVEVVQALSKVQNTKSASDSLALDRGSVRNYDQDGRLHIERTPISKANVCEYYGDEIPDADKLGLDPARKYKLLRDPDELRKAAPTFNNLPLLSEHKVVTADQHDKGLVAGATGTDAEFVAPYLYNSLVVWPQEDIKGVEDDDKRELSCSYHYRADMTPGTYEGQAYDGVMRDIIGNHVALVENGRAGPDVMVHDSQPKPRVWSFGKYMKGSTVSKVSFDAFAKDVHHLVYGNVPDEERYQGYSIIRVPVGQQKGQFQAVRMGLSIGEPVASIADARAQIDNDLARRNARKQFS